MGWVDLLTSLIPLVLTTVGGGGTVAAGFPIVQQVLTWLGNKNNATAVTSLATTIQAGVTSAIADRHAADPTKPVTTPLAPTDIDKAVAYVKGQIADVHTKLTGLGIDPDNLRAMVQAEFGKLLLANPPKA